MNRRERRAQERNLNRLKVDLSAEAELACFFKQIESAVTGGQATGWEVVRSASGYAIKLFIPDGGPPMSGQGATVSAAIQDLERSEFAAAGS